MYLIEQERDSAPEVLTFEVTPEMISAGMDAFYRYSEAYGVGETVARIIGQTLAAAAVEGGCSSAPTVVVCFDNAVADRALSLGHTLRRLELPLRQSSVREAL